VVPVTVLKVVDVDGTVVVPIVLVFDAVVTVVVTLVKIVVLAV
jgi:hypothetical protein